MDPRLQASFIPKKPLMEYSAATARPHQSMNLFSLISWLIFAISLLLALGVFLYNLYLNKNITSLTNTINATEQKYTDSGATLATYSRMDDRLKTASGLLADHIAASPIFAFLEQNTAQNVQMNSFTFTYANGTPNTVNVELTGDAESFNSLGVQANVFSDSPVVQDPVVSNIGLDTNGDVTFLLSASINPDILFYASVVSPGSSAGTTGATGTTTTASGAGASANTPAAASAFQ